MKNSLKLLTAAIIGTLVLSSVAFAYQGNGKSFGGFMQKDKAFQNRECPNCGFAPNGQFGKMQNSDPAKRLEQMKENLDKRVQEGKMTKEEADKIIADCEKRQKDMQDFQNLPLDQKKAKMLENEKQRLDNLVKDSKITQKEADLRLELLKERLTNWDGTKPMGKGKMGGFGNRQR